MRVNNPIFPVDMPDPDVIRRGDTYYMVSTTMFYMPGGAILKSKDLVHWELVSYIFDKLADNAIYELKHGKHAYGKGQWATSLLYYKERYYACFVCHDMGKTFIYHTDDIEKSYWERYEMDEVFHDMSFLLWNGVPYLIYGNGDIGIVELREDLSGVAENGLRQILFSTPKEGMLLRCEGCRAYVRNGYLYLSFIDIPSKEVGSGQRRQLCYRSRNLLGPFEHRIIMDDDMGAGQRGVAQGSFIETKDGNWYAMLFQDRASVGRIPFLMPMSWEKDWPVLGVDGKVPFSFEIPMEEQEQKPWVVSDSFDHAENQLHILWQWNHNPIPECWSFTDRPGYLRLTTGQLAENLMDARNTLTQRTSEPACAFSVRMETDGLKEGDYAGFCAFQSLYGQIGVRVRDGKKEIVMTRRDGVKQLHEVTCDFVGDRISFMIVFDFRNFVDTADFFFCTDGEKWNQLGDTLCMQYTLDVFVGYRIGVFCYATRELGGYADFKDFSLLEII